MDLRKRCEKIYSNLTEYYGINKTNHKLKNLLDVVIATILSQNTNDHLSGKAYENLKRKFIKWEDILNSPLVKIQSAIKIAGLSKQKSLWIKLFLTKIKEMHGKLSLDYLKKKKNEEIIEELIKFKGIGTKTAACLLLFGLHRDVFPVDTHVHRICNRLGLIETKNPEETFYKMINLIPPGSAYDLHLNMIRLGRNICKPKNPRCLFCPLKKECSYENKSTLKSHMNSASGKGKKSEYFILNSI